MKENTTGLEQETETTVDSFMDGFDGAETLESPADQPEEQESEHEETPADEEQKAPETPAAGNENTDAKPDEGVEPEKQEAPEAQEPETTPKTWTLRHLGEDKTVNEQELTALAQKGLDYDRIHGKYEEFRPVMDLFNQFANKAGMNTTDYIAHIRQEAKRAEGLNAEEAKRAVELEDREATVAAKEAAEAERQREQRDAEAQKQSAEAAQDGRYSRVSKDIS
ncbi:hypothetical protein [Dysosmobacter welbionis]|uniref:hypothetical protein n=1 Tax=Dysosmobacter welbionis TaxID=2093857 RepID=UPI00300EF72F